MRAMKASRFVAAIPALLFCLGAVLPPASGAEPPSATNLWSLIFSYDSTSSSPAIAPDGTIYEGTFNGVLFAVTPQGGVKWKFKACLLYTSRCV